MWRLNLLHCSVTRPVVTPAACYNRRLPILTMNTIMGAFRHPLRGMQVSKSAEDSMQGRHMGGAHTGSIHAHTVRGPAQAMQKAATSAREHRDHGLTDGGAREGLGGGQELRHDVC